MAGTDQVTASAFPRARAERSRQTAGDGSAVAGGSPPRFTHVPITPNGSLPAADGRPDARLVEPDRGETPGSPESQLVQRLFLSPSLKGRQTTVLFSPVESQYVAGAL